VDWNKNIPQARQALYHRATWQSSLRLLYRVEKGSQQGQGLVQNIAKKSIVTASGIWIPDEGNFPLELQSIPEANDKYFGYSGYVVLKILE
jgi:hypothetical protein